MRPHVPEAPGWLQEMHPPRGRGPSGIHDTASRGWYKYLVRALGYLKDQGVTSYPWDEFSITIENTPNTPISINYAQSVRDSIVDAQKLFTADIKPVIVAEWGMTNEELDHILPSPPAVPAVVQSSYNALKFYYSTMFFYAHHITAEPPGTFGTTHQHTVSGQIEPVTIPNPPDPPEIQHTNWYWVLQAFYGT